MRLQMKGQSKSVKTVGVEFLYNHPSVYANVWKKVRDVRKYKGNLK